MGPVASTAVPTRPDVVPVLDATDSDVVLRLAVDGRLLCASSSARTLLGWDLEACAEHGLKRALTEPAERAVLHQLLSEVRSTGAARRTVQLPSRVGPLWLDVAAKLLPGEGDRDGSDDHHILISARDVSHDQAAALHLSASELQWRVAFEHSPIGGARLDQDGAIRVVNASLCQMLGWGEQELTRMDVTDVVVGPGGAPWGEWWNAVLAAGGESMTTDRMLATAHGEQVWGRLTAAAVSAPERVILQLENTTGRREAELELANRALHDGLTGAPNRFLTRQWLASALDDNPDSQVGVLYCDLDRFKLVNDSLGHAAGDDLLLQVADRLRGPLRPEDLLGRVGGDEFVLVFEGIRTSAELAEIAHHLSVALDAPFSLGPHQHAVTISIGGSLGSHPDTADDVLMRADMALLRAKRSGRARYIAFDGEHDHVATRADLQLESDLRVSLDADELRAHYQPIVALDDLSVAGHEALVRWQHPLRGLLPPTKFLDMAESSGLIRPLGWWMLSRACLDAAAGRGPLEAPRWVAVNASPSQLARPGVADDVTAALVHSGLPPERLHLEITETALISATATLRRELEQLSELGVHIALDDFGTGYSSLSLLRQFPVDVVKIDRSFIEPMLEDRSAFAIVKAVLVMCHDMGLSTVAEGIETHEQLHLLQELGCSHGQGFLLGRPAPLLRTAGDPPATPTLAGLPSPQLGAKG